MLCYAMVPSWKSFPSSKLHEIEQFKSYMEATTTKRVDQLWTKEDCSTQSQGKWKHFARAVATMLPQEAHLSDSWNHGLSTGPSNIHQKTTSWVYRLFVQQYSYTKPTSTNWCSNWTTTTTVMSKYLEIGSNTYPKMFWGLRLDQTTCEYIIMSKSWSNEYSNIFGCPRVQRTNIWIYTDGAKATNMNTNNICKHFFKIIIVNICLSVPNK